MYFLFVRYPISNYTLKLLQENTLQEASSTPEARPDTERFPVPQVPARDRGDPGRGRPIPTFQNDSTRPELSLEMTIDLTVSPTASPVSSQSTQCVN